MLPEWDFPIGLYVLLLFLVVSTGFRGWLRMRKGYLRGGIWAALGLYLASGLFACGAMTYKHLVNYDPNLYGADLIGIAIVLGLIGTYVDLKYGRSYQN
jgi:hypothetical protein